MQDNQNKNSRVDQGWQQMSDLLDREMPVEKRRKRFAFWWWGIGAILVVGLSAYLIWGGMQGENRANGNSPVVSAEDGVRKNEMGTPGLNSMKGVGQHPSSTKLREQKVSTVPDSDPIAEAKEYTPHNDLQSANEGIYDRDNLGGDNGQMASYLTDHKEQVNNEPPLTNIKAKDPGTADDMESQSDMTQFSIDEISNVEYEANESFIRTPAIEALQFSEELAVQHSPEGASENVPTTQVAKEFIPKQRKRKFDLRAYGGGLGETGSSFYGGLVGLSVEYPLSGKWTVNGGIEYNHLASSINKLASAEDVSFSTDPTLIEGDPLTGGPPLTGFNNFRDVDNIAYGDQISFLNYVVMPLGIEYKFHPRWSVNTGFAVAYLVSAHFNNGYAFNAPEESSNDINEYYRVNPSKEESLNSWDFQHDLGIRFYISRRFDIALNYRHGLTSVLNVQSRESYGDAENKLFDLVGAPERDYNRFLSLELGYRF